jgi:hypothetical protein
MFFLNLHFFYNHSSFLHFAEVHFEISPSPRFELGAALQQPDVLIAMTFADPWQLKKRRRRG